MSTAAYLHMMGVELLSARRLADRDFEFWFADPDNKIEDLRVAFANSEAARFDASQRALKKLVLENGGGNGRTGRGERR